MDDAEDFGGTGYVFCTDNTLCTGQWNEFELIPTVKRKLYIS